MADAGGAPHLRVMRRCLAILALLAAAGACSSGPEAEVFLAARLDERLAREDAWAAHRAERRALDGGRMAAWRSADGERWGWVQPVRLLAHDGRYCREIVHTLSDGATAQDVRGVLCRQADGRWRVTP